MSVIIVRMRPTAATRVNIGASGLVAGGLGAAIKDLCAEIDDLAFMGFYASVSAGEGVALLEGDPSLQLSVYQTLNWSGAFEYVTCEVLLPSDEIASSRVLAEKLGARFNAPNRDEIDRMLLDE